MQEANHLVQSVPFGIALVFLLASIFFVAAGVIMARLLAPHHPYPAKVSNYECGEEPIGSPWIRFNLRFYIIALLFLIFDVEILFIIPWAVEYKNLLHTQGPLVFWDMVVFLFILTLGLVYCWAKGHLEWIVPRNRSEDTASKSNSK